MGTDSAAQKKVMFKKLFLKNNIRMRMTGDSISDRMANEIKKSNYLFRKYSNGYLFNHGIAGSKLANYTTGDYASWNPLSAVSRSYDSSPNKFDITNCDILWIWAGVNDLTSDVPLGTTSSTDVNTIAGAMNIIIENYASRNPNMKVVFVTPNANPYKEVTPNGVGLFLSDIINHIKLVASTNGYYCFDLAAVCDITDANKATVLPDEIHPTDPKLESWTPLFADYLESVNLI